MDRGLVEAIAGASSMAAGSILFLDILKCLNERKCITFATFTRTKSTKTPQKECLSLTIIWGFNKLHETQKSQIHENVETNTVSNVDM